MASLNIIENNKKYCLPWKYIRLLSKNMDLEIPNDPVR